MQPWLSSGDVPLYEAVVRQPSHTEMARASVLRGIMGFGAHHKIHRARLFGVPDGRPIIIAVSDVEERLRAAEGFPRTSYKL